MGIHDYTVHAAVDQLHAALSHGLKGADLGIGDGRGHIIAGGALLNGDFGAFQVGH